MKSMKSKILIIAWLFFIPLVTFATPMNKLMPDDRTFNNDTTTFKGHIENAEFQVWLDIDFYKQNIIVPRQEVFGEVAGYLGAKRDTRKWIISDVEIRGEVATLTIINDYGSEDLIATLTHNIDGTFTFRQVQGSTIKIVVNSKWVKLPKTMVFKP